MKFSPGTRIGPYEILLHLGGGGMGEVYRARDTRLSREVAIKVLPKDLAGNADHLIRFDREARSASALNHPNIITVYDMGFENSTSYLAMELVNGESLREILEKGSLTFRKTINIAVQIADGIAKAHTSGIIHRDLKPENIMISTDGLVKILDFGLAKMSISMVHGLDDQMKTSEGVLLGTVGYMSPEQAMGKPSDFRSDQFSFGCILYEMITGKRAFLRETPVETLTAIINEDPEPVSLVNPQAPAAIRWIIERCLTRDPEERYASTRDLAHDLHAIRNHISEVATSTERDIALQAPRARAKSYRSIVIGILAGILVGGLAVAFFLSRDSSTEPPVLHYLTYSGHDRSPAASPDGKTIAFASDRDGSWRIWLKQLDGPSEVPLTSGSDKYPRFSPDGSMILFIRNEGAWSSLFRVSILGGEARKLIQDVNSADWSPDGKQIAFVQIKNQNGNLSSSVGIAEANGSSSFQIAYFKNLQIQHPRWSPDGKKIVIRTIPFGQVTTPLYVISADGKEKREIAPPRGMGWFSAAAWSGQDTLIFTEPISIVAARSSTSGRLVEQNINTNKIKTLFWSLTLGNTLDIISPGRLVMDGITSRENLNEVVLPSKALPQQNSWLTRGISSDRQPVYSPDGEWVMFSSNRSGNLDLWAISTTTGTMRQITDDAAEDWDPAFTRDGNILWSSSRGGHFEIWTANPDGSNVRQITNDGRDAENPTATPDGKWIVYASYNPDKLGLWKIRSDGTGVQQILKGDSDLPETSPDGKYVLYRDQRADPSAYIRVIRLEDQVILPFEVKVRYTSRHEDLTVGSGGRARWMPDGHAVAFLDRNEEGIQGVYLQDFDPESKTNVDRRPLTGFNTDAPTESFGISPDGLRIAIAGLEAYSSLMIADGVDGISPPR